MIVTRVNNLDNFQMEFVNKSMEIIYSATYTDIIVYDII